MEGGAGRWAGCSEVREEWHLPDGDPNPKRRLLSAAGLRQGPGQRAAPTNPPQCLDSTSVPMASPEASGTVLFTDKQTPKPGLSPPQTLAGLGERWHRAPGRETVAVTAMDMRTRPEA